MLDTLFLQIFDMTKVASLVILIVLLVRLCLKRAPKVISYVLWVVVLFRLLCPVSIEAPISLIPQTEPTIQSYYLLNEPITPIAAIDAAQQAVGDVLNGGVGIQHVYTTDHDEDGTRRIISTDWNTVWILFTKYVWLGGMAALLIYSTVSLIRLKRRLVGAILLRDNIYLADHIDSPFVMGLFRPKIYLPSSLSEKERDYIILHEQHHIRRGDHIIKLLSFTALCLHCFNPLVWTAFILSGKDMEMSCDEAVLQKLGEDIRVDYSASLISLATGRRIIAGTPLAFGEGNTEGRIKNIAKWKKPAVWVIVIASIACVIVAACLSTNPMNHDTRVLGAEYRIDEILYRTDESYSYTDNDTPSICITADYSLWGLDNDGEWEFIGHLQPYKLNKRELSHYTAYESGWLRKYNIGEITDSYILQLKGETANNFFLVFRTKKGDTLLGYGIEDVSERDQDASDDTSLYWLCRLENTFNEKTFFTPFFDRSITSVIGHDVDSFHTWISSNHPGYYIIGFKVSENGYNTGITLPEPKMLGMGYAVFYLNQSPKFSSVYSTLLQCHVYEDALSAENGIFFCDSPAILDITENKKENNTYDVIILNNDSIRKATRVWKYSDGTTKTQTDSSLNGHEMLLYSRENDTYGCHVVQYFYDEHGELIAEYQIKEPISMIPTTANITGAFDSYLYVPIDDAKYRYERIDVAPSTLTMGRLIYSFVEEAGKEDVEWSVYTVDEYPDYSVVLAKACDDYVQLYRYSPSKAVDPAMLENAKNEGKIVVENGYVTSGQLKWDNFYKLSAKSKNASAEIVHYYTLGDPSRYGKEYYEASKEDYPSMFYLKLTYEDGIYTLTSNEYGTEYVHKYKYLRKFEDIIPSQYSSKKIQDVTRYVLTNNNSASWDEIIRSTASSKFGDYIDHFTIYSEKQ